MTKEALPAGQAILALFEITGNIDVPGGLIMPPEILSYGGGWGRELVEPETAKKRIGLDKYFLLQMGFQVAHPNLLIETLETGEPYEIHAAWLQTTNPIACMGADPKRLYNALKDIDLIVVADVFKTPTIVALADIVLPVSMYPERDGIRLGDGVQRGETINKVTQRGECKSDMEINLELGRRFNPEAWPWETVQDMYSFMVASTGLSFEELREEAPVFLPFEYHRYEKGMLRSDGQPGFNTATGRIELWSNFYSNAGLDPLPYFEEPNPGPGATPELLEEYPYVLTTGARQWSSFHSEHRQIKRLRAMHPDPMVYLNPATTAELGLSDGDWVWIENIFGRCKRRVESTLVNDPRIVACDHGWWMPEKDPEQFYDVFDLNCNNLVPWTNGKSGFGSNYKTTLVKIYKVKEGDTNG